MNDRSASAAVSSPLRTLFTLGSTGAMSDGELLGRYLDGRADEAELAFSALVERHGPMVRHACLAVLDDLDDAGDAFQAAFLVLARRAPSIRDAESVGPWLYGVSRRVSLKARSAASRRRRAERSKAEQDAARPDAAEPDGQLPEDWAPLYQELDRLPPRYRDPLILCYLEGLSYDQAASRLGCPTGTLRTRLSRAKARLRARLSRRGLSPTDSPSALLAPAISPSALAPLPTGWAAAASRLALAARGLPLASLSAPLAVATLRSMTMIALTRSIALGGASLLGLGAGIAALSAAPGPGPAGPAAAPPLASSAIARSAQQDAEPPSEGEPGVDEPYSIRGTINSGELATSEVEGPTRVLKLVVPEGAIVEEGQVVVELDDSGLKDQLATQRIDTNRAQADYANAIKAREVAELDVEHFRNGAYPLEERMLFGEIEIAQAELDLARRRFETLGAPAEAAQVELDLGRSRPGFSPAPVEDAEKPDFASMPIEHQEARIKILRAELDLKKAEGALDVLNQHTFAREIKRLEAVVEQAKSDEISKRYRFELEKEKEEQLRRMIERCQVKAPAGGVVRYADGVLEDLAEGTPVQVQRGQTIFMVVTGEFTLNGAEDPGERSDPDRQFSAFVGDLTDRLSSGVPLSRPEMDGYRARYERLRPRVDQAPDFATLLGRVMQMVVASDDADPDGNPSDGEGPSAPTPDHP